MKIGEAFPSKYIKATDIPSGKMFPLTMAHVEIENVGTEEKPEHKPVLYFAGKTKGMILNKTNAEEISKAFGDDTDHWAGHTIVIYQTPVSYQGKPMPGLRVSAEVHKPAGVGFPAAAYRPAPAPPPQNPIGDAQEFQAEDVPF